VRVGRECGYDAMVLAGVDSVLVDSMVADVGGGVHCCAGSDVGDGGAGSGTGGAVGVGWHGERCVKYSICEREREREGRQ
jgi:hypothetical protein